MSPHDLERAAARADLCRFLAACFYQPGPEFAEERIFDSMLTAAAGVHPEFAARVRSLDHAFAAERPEDLLVDYTRLFLGPVNAVAQPYGSVWLGGHALMQDSTVAVREIYDAAGFEIDEVFRELPDHIAAELEFLYLLLFREAEALRNGDPAALAAMADLRRRFLAEHLGAWVGPFTTAVTQGAKTAFYRGLAELTDRFVASETQLRATTDSPNSPGSNA